MPKPSMILYFGVEYTGRRIIFEIMPFNQSYTCEDLRVFQSDTFRLQQPLDENFSMNRFFWNFENTLGQKKRNAALKSKNIAC